MAAGCTGGQNDNRDGQESGGRASEEETSSTTTESGGITEDDVPEFTVDEDAQPTPVLLAHAFLDAPEQIESMDRLPTELAVGNAGGEVIGDQEIEVSMAFPDDDDAPMGAASVNEPDPVTVTISDIESGDWKTVETELRVNAGGNWTISTDAETHPEFEPDIDVAPRSLEVEETFVSEVGEYEITALEPAFERGMQYELEEGGVGLMSEDATGLLSADDDHVLVVHRFRIENTRDGSLGFGAVSADNLFKAATLNSDPEDLIFPDDIDEDAEPVINTDEFGELFDNIEIPAGETRDLVAIQEVSEDEIPEATLTLSLWGDTEEYLFEPVEETPSLPQFELVDSSISDSGDDPVIEFTVENVGDAEGTFRGAGQFYFERMTDTDWVFLPDGVETTLEPGEEETMEIVASRGEEEFRILPFEEEVSL